MPELDVFNHDAFSATSMTKSINKAPFMPRRVGQMGLFRNIPVATTTILLEEIEGIVALLDTQPRGAPPTVHKTEKRKARALVIPHVPYNDGILAESIQNTRAVDSTELQNMSTVVNNKLQTIRDLHETTHEYHKLGALKGNILDADGSSVILNLFTEFGTTEQTNDFVIGTDNMRAECLAVKRLIETALGGAVYDHIHCLASEGFLNALLSDTTFGTAFERYQNGELLRNDPRSGFSFGGIIFEEYRGAAGVDSVAFLPANTARFFPVGVPGLFRSYWGPGTTTDSVNVLGKPIFAHQEPMRGKKGIEIFTESNGLHLCTRPRCLVKGTHST